MVYSLLLLATPFLQDVQFAPPVRVMAGDKYLGARRMYASPAVHDVNGDGKLDALIGDLPGRVTVAYGNGEYPPSFEEEVPLTTSDGNDIDFGNW